MAAFRRISVVPLGWIVEADGDGLVPKKIFFERVRQRYRLTEPVAQMWAAYRRRHPAS